MKVFFSFVVFFFLVFCTFLLVRSQIGAANGRGDFELWIEEAVIAVFLAMPLWAMLLTTLGFMHRKK